MTTKENEMSERAQLLIMLRLGCRGSDESGAWEVDEFATDALLDKAADLIEQQAKELAALRKAILNQCGSELAESIEIEAHHAK